MNRVQPSFIGLLLAANLWLCPPALALYDEIRAITAREFLFNQAELSVEKAVPVFMQSRKESFGFTVEREDVDRALRGSFANICSTLNGCSEHVDEIATVTHKAARLRTLGRDLQLIATSYERGAVGITGQTNTLSAKLSSIVNVWQSGSDEMTNPVIAPRIQAGSALERLPEGNVLAVEQALEDLIERDGSKISRERLTAAVWRYQHGYRELQTQLGGCQPDGDGTELELLTVRFCVLEQALERLHQSVTTDQDRAAGPNQFVVFPISNIGGPEEEQPRGSVSRPNLNDDTVPKVIVWVRNDDAGLQWDIALEPVLPALVAQDGNIVLGGTYPEPLDDADPNTGICSHPFGRQGYLCRPLRRESCPQSGPDTPQTQLTKCVPQHYRAPIQDTISGPDICEVGGWRQLADDGGTPDQCQHCRLALTCGGPTCGQLPTKAPDGSIEICVDDSLGAPAYSLLRQLVGAQAVCNAPAGSRDVAPTDQACCTRAWYPNLVACRALMEDGNLTDLNISIETCAAALASEMCAGAACLETPLPANLAQQIRTAAQENVGNLPLNCSEAIDLTRMDPRARSTYASMPRPCSPNCVAEYENTIGNNLCYIGQCIEQSLEEHRLIPGRVPMVAGDEAYPWDACMLPDPQLGSALSLPPLVNPTVPAYRLPAIIKTLDVHLCQGNGLPALSPPILCSFHPEPQTAGFLTLRQADRGLREAEFEQFRAAQIRQLQLANISARLATELQVQYLKGVPNSFFGLITLMNDLLEQMSVVRFPHTMCPRQYTGDCSIFAPLE